MQGDAADHADELEDLLDSEREALLAGDVEGAVRLAETKLALLEQLPCSPAHATERLRAKAERNQALIGAAARGVRAAIERLAQLRDGPPALRTYDARGRAQTHPHSAGGICRKA